MSTSLNDLRNKAERDQRNSAQRDMDTHPFFRTVVSAATGIVFGIAIEKGRVFEPQVIRDQMLFRRFIMLKMFLSAALIGLVCFSFMTSLPETARRMEIAIRNFTPGVQYKTLLGVIVGGALLGSGMTLAGACPGVVLAQLGAQVPNAWYTVGGALVGAALYAMTESFVAPFFRKKTKANNNYLDQYMGFSFFNFALPFASVMALVVFGLEKYAPWHTEIPSSLLSYGVMRAGAWPPFVSGMVIGTLQIPTVLVNGDTLGSATSYMTLVSQAFPSWGSLRGSNHLKQYSSGMNNWWQVIYMGGAVFGSFLSAYAAKTQGSVAGFPWYQCFAGGLTMLYGARLAGGCTSGHGLSGMGLLSLMSFVAVPAMFAGGIGTAFFMKDILRMDI